MNIWKFLSGYVKIAAPLGIICIAAAIFGSPDEPKTAFITGIFFLVTSGLAYIFSKKSPEP
ncbi:MAG TPA: hypothetical protein VN420_04275 [Candidatus Fimivivens sp.]|nr:hypothetical protein [Candidatus Fimivivens sp.]